MEYIFSSHEIIVKFTLDNVCISSQNATKQCFPNILWKLNIIHTYLIYFSADLRGLKRSSQVTEQRDLGWKVRTASHRGTSDIIKSRTQEIEWLIEWRNKVPECLDHHLEGLKGGVSIELKKIGERETSALPGDRKKLSNLWKKEVVWKKQWRKAMKVERKCLEALRSDVTQAQKQIST